MFEFRVSEFDKASARQVGRKSDGSTVIDQKRLSKYLVKCGPCTELKTAGDRLEEVLVLNMWELRAENALEVVDVS